MKKKILISSLLLFSMGAKLFAQENDDAPKAKKEEKVIIKKTGKGKKSEKMTVIVDDQRITVNGEPIENLSEDKKIKKQKRITVMVDGDNITINGKPIDKMSEQDLMELKGSADHLGVIAPFINGTIKGTSEDGGHFEGKFSMPQDEFLKEPNKALLGVTTEKNEKGAVITSVSKGSAAEIFGLQTGDIIIKINDDNINNPEDLMNAIGKHKPKDLVNIAYSRGKLTLSGDVALGLNEMDVARIFRFNNEDAAPMEMFPFNGNANGDFKILHKSMKPKLGLKIQDVEEGNGVKVLGVDENTPAAKAGLQNGDIISEMNGEAIKTVDDIKEKTKTLKEGETYKVKYLRNGTVQTTDIKFPKKLKTVDL